ncbi:hypothetical protein ACPTJF_24145, partial [Enterococcus faecalis]
QQSSAWFYIVLFTGPNPLSILIFLLKLSQHHTLAAITNKNEKKQLEKIFSKFFSRIIIVAEFIPNNNSDILGLYDELES